MEVLFILYYVTTLLSLSMAQCTGTLSNSTAGVSVSWSVVSANSVGFTYSAPCNSSEFIFLAFSNNTVRLMNEMNMTIVFTTDMIIAGDNGTQNSNFVEDRWINGSGPPDYDAQQDITNTNTRLSNEIRTLNFTRPIISTDKKQDLDLNECRYVRWAYGGTVTIMDPNASATITSIPPFSGMFSTHICLQRCPIVSPSSGFLVRVSFIIITIATILSFVF